MLRYRLPLRRAGRFYGSLDSKNETDTDQPELSEEVLSIKVQHASSRDEVETFTQASPREEEQREPNGEVPVDEIPQLIMGMDLSSSKATEQLQVQVSALRSIRKLKTTIAKSGSKLVRRNKQSPVMQPPAKQVIDINGEPVELREAVSVVSPVMVRRRQDSISTLSHADFVVPRDLPLSPGQRNSTVFLTKHKDDPGLVDLDLSLDDMSLSAAPSRTKDAVKNACTTSISRPHPTDIWSACRMGDEGFVRGALAHNRNVLMLEHQGRTPLYYAAHAGHVNIVQLLLESGATDPDGTAYMSALNKECRKLLAKSKSIRPTEEDFEHPRDHIIIGPGDRNEKSLLAEKSSRAITADSAIEIAAPQANETHKQSTLTMRSDTQERCPSHENSYQSFGLDNGTSGSGETDEDDGYMSDASSAEQSSDSDESEREDDHTMSSCESGGRPRKDGLARVFPSSWLSKSGANVDPYPCDWQFDVCKL